jgi:hypothetical protein
LEGFVFTGEERTVEPNAVPPVSAVARLEGGKAGRGEGSERKKEVHGRKRKAEVEESSDGRKRKRKTEVKE